MNPEKFLIIYLSVLAFITIMYVVGSVTFEVIGEKVKWNTQALDENFGAWLCAGVLWPLSIPIVAVCVTFTLLWDAFMWPIEWTIVKLSKKKNGK